MNTQNKTITITVTDIDIPYNRLVVILLKWMVAAIPAILLFYMLIGLILYLGIMFTRLNQPKVEFLPGSSSPSWQQHGTR